MSLYASTPGELPEAAAQLVWYCGIGSMMNSTALGLRGIRPARSLWCEILDHRRVFYAPGGMATLVEEEGAVTHAVAHEITEAELRDLEDREPPSVPIRVRLCGAGGDGALVSGVASVARHFVFLRGIGAKAEDLGARVSQVGTGATGRITAVCSHGVNVSAFSVSEFSTSDVVLLNDREVGAPSLVSQTPPLDAEPSARYLELMLEGARAVGMDREQVERLEATPCTPRKRPDELLRIAVDTRVAHRRFSWASIEKCDALTVFRGMVLEHPIYPGTVLPAFLRGVRDLGDWYAHQMYDPRYGIPPADPLEPWGGWPWIEDMMCTFLPGLRHVGWVEPEGLQQEKRMSKL